MYQRLQLFIKRLLENSFVQIPNQMDQAFLLRATDRIIGRIEIGDQDALETSEELLGHISFTSRRPDVHHLLHAREYPNVAITFSCGQVGLISVHELSMQQRLLDLLIRTLIELCRPALHAVDRGLAHLITEELEHTSRQLQLGYL